MAMKVCGFMLLGGFVGLGIQDSTVEVRMMTTSSGFGQLRICWLVTLSDNRFYRRYAAPWLRMSYLYDERKEAVSRPVSLFRRALVCSGSEKVQLGFVLINTKPLSRGNLWWKLARLLRRMLSFGTPGISAVSR